MHIYNTSVSIYFGLPRQISGKNLWVSIPGLGRSPGEGNGYLLQYFCLGNPIDRGAWQATVHEVIKESDTTQRLNNSNPYILCIYILKLNTNIPEICLWWFIWYMNKHNCSLWAPFSHGLALPSSEWPGASCRPGWRVGIYSQTCQGKSALRAAYSITSWMVTPPRDPPLPHAKPVDTSLQAGYLGFSNLVLLKVPKQFLFGGLSVSLNNKSHGLGALTRLTSSISTFLYLLERNDSLFLVMVAGCRPPDKQM